MHEHNMTHNIIKNKWKNSPTISAGAVLILISYRHQADRIVRYTTEGFAPIS